MELSCGDLWFFCHNKICRKLPHTQLGLNSFLSLQMSKSPYCRWFFCHFQARSSCATTAGFIWPSSSLQAELDSIHTEVSGTSCSFPSLLCVCVFVSPVWFVHGLCRRESASVLQQTRQPRRDWIFCLKSRIVTTLSAVPCVFPPSAVLKSAVHMVVLSF